MKLICLPSLVIMVLILTVLANAQLDVQKAAKFKAYKTDKFETFNEATLKIKLDSFFDKLIKNKDSKGYILIFGRKDKSTDLTREKVLKGINWKLLPKRFYVARLKAKGKGKQLTEFWIVPIQTNNISIETN